jgi:hypothetical protein
VTALLWGEVAHVPSGELDIQRDAAKEAIFHLENVDEWLRDAPTVVDGRAQLIGPDVSMIRDLVHDVRSDIVRLRELADSIDQRVRATHTLEGT